MKGAGRRGGEKVRSAHREAVATKLIVESPKKGRNTNESKEEGQNMVCAILNCPWIMGSLLLL